MKFLSYFTGWSICLLFMGQPVFSQLRDTVELDAVVVTGEMKPILADQSLYQIKSISAREIRGRGATNLSELLSNQLSFRVSQDAVLGSSLKLNGLGGEHVKILVDGIPIVGRQGGILDLNQINLFRVDHIEVVEGPMSVIYGSNALGGVINIITQRPVFGQKSIYKFRTYYESVGVYNADADITVNRGSNTFNLSGGRHFFGGFSAPGDSFRVQTWKPKLQWNADANYSYRYNKFILNLGTSYFNEELRNKAVPVLVTLADENEKHYRSNDEYHYTIRNLNKIDLSLPLNSNLTTTFIASYSYYRKAKLTKVKDLVTLEEFPLEDSKAQDTTTFKNYMGRWMLGGNLVDKLEMQSGLEYNQENGSGKRIGGDRSITEAAGFLSLKYNLMKPLSIQTGARYIHNSQFHAPLVYNVNALWDLNSKAKMRFSVGKGFRAPSLKELYFEFIDVNHNVLGNDSLKAEESFFLGFNSDYDVRDNLDAHLSISQNIIDNKIELLYDSQDATKAQYFNLPGKPTYVRGFKASLNYNWQQKLNLEAGTQITGQSKINSNSYNWTTDLTLNGTYNFPKLKSKVSAFYKFNGKYVIYTADYNEFKVIDKINENFLDKYHSMDVILTKWLWDEKLEISTGVKNIFNNKNIVGKGSSGPHSGGNGNNPVGWGRTLFLQLQFNLNHDHKPAKI